MKQSLYSGHVNDKYAIIQNAFYYTRFTHELIIIMLEQHKQNSFNRCKVINEPIPDDTNRVVAFGPH